VINAQTIANTLIGSHALCEGEIVLDLDNYKIRVCSNSEALLEKLGIYFSSSLGLGPADIEVVAIDGDAPDLAIDYIDWKRETGKSGRKDTYFDLIDGRIIRKARTGMVFLQSRDFIIASGPSLKNDNQVINFINAQYMNHLQHQGALICHASGLVTHGKSLAMAGFSGGGKSTLMLHMMAEKGVSYLTNDRLFLSDKDGQVSAHGIPKLPRINPGTIINNKHLRMLLNPERIDELKALPMAELWDLEEKYDVFIEDIFGENKTSLSAPLAAFLVLNWSHNSQYPCDIHQVDLTKRHDLLSAIMKAQGPFFQDLEGVFSTDEKQLDKTPYLSCLKDIPIFEARGKVDFDFAKQFCLKHLKTHKG
jgi:HprK-related kinase B